MPHSPLLKVAMLGLNRAPLPDKLGLMGLEPPILGEQAEGRLLEAAGFQSLAKKAGFQPISLPQEAQLEVAEAESLSYIDRRSSDCLKQILNGNNQRLLEEFLALIQRKQCLVSPEHLPKLFQWLLVMKLERSTYLPVIGKRGYWLAEMRKEWHILLPPKADLWKIGSTAERVDWLGYLRRQGPEQARALLQKEWESCSFRELSKMVPVLQIHLQEGDEALLEQLAQHRRKEVRVPAKDLLARLPKGRLVRRVQGYLADCLQLVDGTVEITLPEELTEEMQADGIDQALPLGGHAMGQKGAWLAKMVSMIPPSYWEKEWDLSPKTCLDLLTKHTWKGEMLRGWVAATLRFEDSAWALALLQASIFDQSPFQEYILPNEKMELASCTGLDTLSEWLEGELAKRRYAEDLVPLFTIMLGAKGQLSTKSAWLFAQKLASLLHHQRQHPYMLRAFIYNLSEISYVLPAKLYPQIAECWMKPQEDEPWYEKHLELALQLLEFRYQMNGYESITPTR